MASNEQIVNKVAQSGLITLDLAKYIPDYEIAVFDIKEFLFRGLILKEKEFRTALEEHNWEQYKDKYIGITCSADAIIPQWAYMLVANYLENIAADVIYGDEQSVSSFVAKESLKNIHPEDYLDQRVIIKGCGDEKVTAAAYLEITRLLVPYAKTIMYGEPCSTVPVYKKKK